MTVHRTLGLRVRKEFWRKVAKNGISFLTLSKCGIISNFGVNLFRMSASSELEPHPSCPQARYAQLTARPAAWTGGRGNQGAEDPDCTCSIRGKEGEMLFATEIVGAAAYDAQNHFVGRVREFFVEPAEQPNRISHFLFSGVSFLPLVAR